MELLDHLYGQVSGMAVSQHLVHAFMYYIQEKKLVQTGSIISVIF